MGLQFRGWPIGTDTDRKVVGEGGSVSWGGARTEGKGRECELTKNILSHIDMLKLCLNKKHGITDFFPDTTVFYD